MSGISIGKGRGGIATCLLCLAMLMRLLVPAGWMPIETPTGGWAITLCTGSGPMTMAATGPVMSAMTGMRHGSDQQDHGSGDHPCPYSSLAMALDGAVPPLLDAPRLILALWSASLGGAVSVGRGLAAPPPPSTGPPHA